MQAAEPEDIQENVRRARLGDSDAFAQLYTLYFTPLYRYVYFRVTNKADADDLTQEVFLKAYTSFQNYVPSSESPLPYFYTIARNMVIDHYRKKKTLVLNEDTLHQVPDTATASPEDEAATKEEYLLIQTHVTYLPEDQQDALVLRFINGLSNKEIARVMKKSEVAVRQLQSRGLRSLREAIGSQ
jgi:RNA polymerase sigma-70 factor (ECF subfamily)